MHARGLLVVASLGLRGLCGLRGRLVIRRGIVGRCPVGWAGGVASDDSQQDEPRERGERGHAGWVRPAITYPCLPFQSGVNPVAHWAVQVMVRLGFVLCPARRFGIQNVPASSCPIVTLPVGRTAVGGIQLPDRWSQRHHHHDHGPALCATWRRHFEHLGLPMTARIRHPCQVDPAEHYERLVRDLDGWTSASQLTPGRIQVSVPQAGRGRRTVVIVMTPTEWENMFSVAYGSFDSALDRVKQTLLAMKPHERFAVYAGYGLEPSRAETLPEPVLPEPGSGEWVVYDRHGVARRLGDFPEDSSEH